MGQARARRPATAAVPVLAVALGVAFSTAGCGGEHLNGIEKRPPAQIKTVAVATLRGTRGVRIVGVAPPGASTGGFDLRMTRTASTGTLDLGGETVGIVITGGVVYLKGSPAFYAAALGNAAAIRAGKHWIKLPTSQTKQFAPFTLAGVTADANAGAAADATVTKARLDGVKAVRVAERDGSTLYVANTGKPYPLRAATGGSRPVTTTFSQFDQAVTVTPPTDVVTLTDAR